MIVADLHERIRAHLNWGSLQGEERIRFLALALCGETGELANLVKKDWRGDGGAATRRAEIVKELADVGNYVFMLAEAYGIDLPTEMLAKLAEVEKRPDWQRKHPGDRSA